MVLFGDLNQGYTSGNYLEGKSPFIFLKISLKEQHNSKLKLIKVLDLAK